MKRNMAAGEKMLEFRGRHPCQLAGLTQSQFLPLEEGDRQLLRDAHETTLAGSHSRSILCSDEAVASFVLGKVRRNSIICLSIWMPSSSVNPG